MEEAKTKVKQIMQSRCVGVGTYVDMMKEGSDSDKC